MPLDPSDGVAHVRKRPGMYFGSTGPGGISHLVLEVVSNSFDEVLSGYCDHIEVTLHRDGSATVADNGRGISIVRGADGMTFLERAFTVVGTEPTADGHTPHVHLAAGVGLAPVSALCERVDVEVRNELGVHHQVFARGVSISDLRSEPRSDGASGTTIRLAPDPLIYGTTRYDAHRIEGELENLALLTPGLTIDFHVEPHSFGPVGDLSALFERSFNTPALLHDDPFIVSKERGILEAHLALGWQKTRRRPALRSFCNYRETDEGGSHTLGIEEGLRLVFGNAPTNKVMEGLSAVVHVTMLDPNFQGPTRGRLDSPEAIWIVADAIAEGLPDQLELYPSLKSDLASRMTTPEL